MFVISLKKLFKSWNSPPVCVDQVSYHKQPVAAICYIRNLKCHKLQDASSKLNQIVEASVWGAVCCVVRKENEDWVTVRDNISFELQNEQSDVWFPSFLESWGLLLLRPRHEREKTHKSLIVLVEWSHFRSLPLYLVSSYRQWIGLFAPAARRWGCSGGHLHIYAELVHLSIRFLPGNGEVEVLSLGLQFQQT